LSGAPVMASDLRASSALVIAGLAARGRDAGQPHLPSGSRLRKTWMRSCGKLGREFSELRKNNFEK